MTEHRTSDAPCASCGHPIAEAAWFGRIHSVQPPAVFCSARCFRGFLRKGEGRFDGVAEESDLSALIEAHRWANGD